jgi:putative hydrolases of HD superfamily
MNTKRFKNQLDFIIEADKIKNILRRTKIFDSSRFENDAEHSWTVCLMAVLLKEYSNFEINIEKVLIMLIIHDIVEVVTGDTFLYAKERDTAYLNEEVAARQIFGMLPPDQSKYFYDIWKEFEERKTNESKFASVFDRFEPLLQNYKTEGYTWKKHGITKSIVLEKNKYISEGSIEIWNFFLALLDECVQKGYLEDL